MMRTLGAFVGFVLALALCWYGVAMTGAGHGTYGFLLLGLLSLPVLPVMGWRLGKRIDP